MLFRFMRTISLMGFGRLSCKPRTSESRDSSHPRGLHNVTCAKCDMDVGVLSTERHSISLFKWQATCETMTHSRAPTAPECLAATLLASFSRSGSAKAVVLPIFYESPVEVKSGDIRPPHAEQVLHLWMLNTSISYSSSEEAEGPKNAIKLLYRIIDRDTADKLTEPVTSDIQDLSFARDALDQSISYLDQSNLLLPEDQRRYNGFKVGLLIKYSDKN
ncbi:unnamed protein product [Parascedosporium putredinis]|uniref:Uncharacterized protein n=1 Tax=Parascedosporium putredinis TaxID=1442378 RepID=A0A9P1H450_9PEZI|nr:unnamed protein product [Parascedosporium putredinis]CAI7997911.1 unnamed protein product [Parascedosporium putredinis]